MQEERLKELKPWILLVTLQGCPRCKRPTAALCAVLGEMMCGRDCHCSLEKKDVNAKKEIWRYPDFQISSEGGNSRTESHKGKWRLNNSYKSQRMSQQQESGSPKTGWQCQV